MCVQIQKFRVSRNANLVVNQFEDETTEYMLVFVEGILQANCVLSASNCGPLLFATFWASALPIQNEMVWTDAVVIGPPDDKRASLRL